MNEFFRTLAVRLPRPLLQTYLGRALSGLNVALCLHRVSIQGRRPGEMQPALSIPAAELDALVELLLASRRTDERWLTLTFDDGYADAAEYIRTRAERFPTVDLLLFLCAAKTEQRVGFRWDLVEQGEASFAEIGQRTDVRTENQRPELARLASLPDYALATVEECQQLARLPNVQLGNHTNCHFRQTSLSLEDAQLEYETSKRDFERLFGPQRHFAFPFGTPGKEFDASHVERLRAMGDPFMWSTVGAPYRQDEVRPGAVLPRFPIDGRETHQQLAFWIASRAVTFRWRSIAPGASSTRERLRAPSGNVPAPPSRGS
jgi:peptidoglycan/xylan/chitin deacetylase (PgdA/CDA1 family)